MTTREPLESRSELIVHGDWACALADGGELARVCTELAARDRELAGSALRVAAWVEQDLRVACEYWLNLRRELRPQTAEDG